MSLFSYRHFLRRNMQGIFICHSFWRLGFAQIYMSLGVQEEVETEIPEIFFLCSFPRDAFLQGQAKWEVGLLHDSYGSWGSSLLGSCSQNDKYATFMCSESFFSIFFFFCQMGGLLEYSLEHELQHLQNKHAGNAEKGIYLLWVYGNCSRLRRRKPTACRAGSKFPSLLMGLISMQGHYQGDTAATVHLPARGASLPKQFHTPWKLSGQLRSNTPRQSETWNEIKRKKHNIVNPFCICIGDIAYKTLGRDLQGMAASYRWMVRWGLMKIKGSEPGQGSGSQETMARS